MFWGSWLGSLLWANGNMAFFLGGILTVADDLLKNDGKKFIEMMEQLAERRMAREVDTAPESYTRGYGHGVNGNLPVHDHPPPPPVDDDEYDDDEEDDYDSQEDDEYEEDDDDVSAGCVQPDIRVLVDA